MAKQKTKKRIHLFGRSFRLWQIGIVIILVFFTSLFVYNLYLDAQDRKKFDEIETTLTEFANRTDNNFNTVSNKKILRFCEIRQFKLSPPVFVCSVNVIYDKGAVLDEVALADYVSKQDDLFRAMVYESPNKAFDGDRYYLRNYPEVECFVDSYDSELAVGCSDLAREAYYPEIN